VLIRSNLLSQVLFTLNELRIPDALGGGPRTARQIAAAACPAADPEWVERLMRAAASFGLVTRLPASRRVSWWRKAAAAKVVPSEPDSGGEDHGVPAGKLGGVRTTWWRHRALATAAVGSQILPVDREPLV
jgi:hypothetical protein